MENKVDQVIDMQTLRNAFSHCDDVTSVEMVLPSCDSLLLMYCGGMVDTNRLNSVILPNLEKTLSTYFLNLQASLVTSQIPVEQLREEVEDMLFSGHVVFYWNGVIKYVPLSDIPNRQTEESVSEPSVKGPRDAFTESIQTNVALIRKRLPTRSLFYEQFTVGTRSKTKVGIFYIKDVIEPETVEKVLQTLRGIHIDSLLNLEKLEEILSERKYSLFPLLDNISRPDFAVSTLIHGRFVILVDGIPNCLVGPTNSLLFIKSPEDLHNSFYFVTLQRLLRVVSLFLATLLPGFWVALTAYQVEQLPYMFLATVANSRKGLPIPTQMEMIMMLLAFELFKEAGIRLPKAVGHTVSVVGGLIIGQAAIQAGLTSPITLVIVSITVIASFTLVNQSLNAAVTLVRLFIVSFSSFFGIFGFFISIFFVLMYLSTLKSITISYLPSFTPLNLRSLFLAIVRIPFSSIKDRPAFLNPKDKTRM